MYYRTEDLQVRAQLQAKREANITEKEAQLSRVERDMRAKDQTQRERETAQNAKEETLRNAEEVLRNKEAYLFSWEQKLIKEQQLLEEKYRILQEQEKTFALASRKSLSSGSSSTEAMMVDSKSTSDLHSAVTTSSNSTAMDTNGTNGITYKHTRSAGHTSKPTLFATNHKTTMPTSNSYPVSMFSASVNAAPKGPMENSTIAGDAGSMTRAAPRRKTGLNVGRHSLQTTNASRARTSGGLGGTGTTSHTGSADTQDKGGLFSGGQTSNNPIIMQPRPSSVFASLSSIDNASNLSKQYQGQSYTFHHGLAGKESRLSGRPSLTGNTGLDAPRLRAKAKSASTLVATLSSTTLSGAGGATTSAAPSTSSGNTPSNHTNNSFLVSDIGKSAATNILPTTTTTTTTAGSSAADQSQSNITFGNNSNATFYFTPSATLSSIRVPSQDLNSESSDVQMGESAAETPTTTSSSSTTTTRLSSGTPSTTNGHSRTGTSQTNGVSSDTASSTASGVSAVAVSSAASSSSAVTSAPQQMFTSRRSNTSSIAASLGNIRFQQQQSGSTPAVTNGATISTPTIGAATSQATASTSAIAVGSAAGGAHDTNNSTTTPIKFHIGSGGGGGSGGSGNGKGERPHNLGSDRFSRDRTPPPNNSNRYHHHHHSQHHHQLQQQQQQHGGGHYRDDDEDLRMEWDGDIPSPFIKKTYSRPLGGANGGGGGGVISSSAARNL
ncbi:MAG: hypothetical protein JOS17DRAFT_363449 [Linnemannia elongata]|nr:MAG: hypothetical protein JOS17DRAFT_363449 [Linnemannia elongata]